MRAMGQGTESVELAEARSKLAEQRQQLAFALDATGVGLWSWSADTDRIDWDEVTCGTFRRLVPKSLDEYLGFIHPEDRSRSAEHISKAVRSGHFDDFELRIVRPDGSIRWVSGKGRAQLAENGEAQRLVGGILDVTDQHRLREELHMSRKLEAVGQLAEGVAHHFNNLFTVALANIELSLAQCPAEAQESLRESSDAVLRAAELVRQLTLFAGRHPQGSRDNMAFAALVERTVGVCRATFQNEVRIELALDPDLGAVAGDASQIEQLILNLMVNARDAFEGSEVVDRYIEVRANRYLRPTGQSMLELRIIDNGAGMSDEVRARATEPFFTTKPIGRGTGLGLPSVHAIVQEHAGRLSIESQVGVGTTVIVELPSAEPSRVEPARPVERPEFSGGGQLILVVDDEPAVRRVLGAVLSSAGFQVEQAGDGAEALDFVARDPRQVALVVLDQSMPGMSGGSVLTELRRIAPAIPVLGVTGSTTPFADSDGTLQKPMTADALLAAVADLIQRG